MAGQHATFAPSKAPTWVNCYGALAYAASLGLKEEPANIHAASGTLTHQIAEDMFAGVNTAPGTSAAADGFTFVIDAERIERAAKYVKEVLDRGGLQFYEYELTGYPWPGTADAVVALPGGVLEVHDLKDGSGQVFAKDNEQGVAYLLLAWKDIWWMDDFQTFRFFIHQPRIGWADGVEYTADEMRAWLEKFETAHARGQAAFGRTTNQIQAALTPGDKQCKWCRARSQCRKRADFYAGVPSTPPAALSDEEIGKLLTGEAAVTAFFSDLRGEALSRAKTGTKIPGWKLGMGRQGPRAWKKDDLEKIGDTLYEVLLADAYERTLVSPTVAQKKLKQHADVWLALQPSIERSPGRETLIPESDLRPAIEAPEFGLADGSDVIGNIETGESK